MKRYEGEKTKGNTRGKYDYSEEKINFLSDNVIGLRLEELTELFNEKFNCKLTKHEVQMMKNHLKLTSGLDTRAKRGVSK